MRKEPLDSVRATKAVEEASKILNYARNVLDEAASKQATFSNNFGSARLLKWLFASLQLLLPQFSIAGRAPNAAAALIDYYEAKDLEQSDEWAAYLNTGRTGRIDSADVRACLEHLMVRIINFCEADPIDPKRFFSQQQRKAILTRQEKRCALCDTELSFTNAHIDHIKPHKAGGTTTLENGQALCSACNRRKGGSWDFGTAA